MISKEFLISFFLEPKLLLIFDRSIFSNERFRCIQIIRDTFFGTSTPTPRTHPCTPRTPSQPPTSQPPRPPRIFKHNSIFKTYGLWTVKFIRKKVSFKAKPCFCHTPLPRVSRIIGMAPNLPKKLTFSNRMIQS